MTKKYKYYRTKILSKDDNYSILGIVRIQDNKPYMLTSYGEFVEFEPLNDKQTNQLEKMINSKLNYRRNN